MKEFFLNSRGLSDLAKSRFLADSSKEQNLDLLLFWKLAKKYSPNPFGGGYGLDRHWKHRGRGFFWLSLD